MPAVLVVVPVVPQDKNVILRNDHWPKIVLPTATNGPGFFKCLILDEDDSIPDLDLYPF